PGRDGHGERGAAPGLPQRGVAHGGGARPGVGLSAAAGPAGRLRARGAQGARGGAGPMNRDPRRVLIRPLMTEKSMQQKEVLNTVAFRVRTDANKVEIRAAVESVFNVKVTAVRTASYEGKLKRMGRFQGRRADWKKAIVTLAPGHKIDLIEGA